MPTIKDKVTGDVVAEIDYDNPEAENIVEDIVKNKPNLEVDYSPGGTQNAPDMRESYQLGGQVPGQPGFGERPQPVNPGMNPLGIEQVTPSASISPLYKKGGKVDKYTKK